MELGIRNPQTDNQLWYHQDNIFGGPTLILMSNYLEQCLNMKEYRIPLVKITCYGMALNKYGFLFSMK